MLDINLDCDECGTDMTHKNSKHYCEDCYDSNYKKGYESILSEIN